MMSRAGASARAARMWRLRAQGVPVREIAERYGITAKAVYRLLQHHEPQQPPAPRPWWKPDRDLLRVAREIRKEIATAEGFERPRP